jgi:hypothetical protein
MQERIFRMLCVAGLAGFPWLGALAAQPQGTAPQFPVRADAEAHCPGEVVVWVDLATKIYYYRGQDLYGSTKQGVYACQRDVKDAGFRPNRSGR